MTDDTPPPDGVDIAIKAALRAARAMGPLSGWEQGAAISSLAAAWVSQWAQSEEQRTELIDGLIKTTRLLIPLAPGQG